MESTAAARIRELARSLLDRAPPAEVPERTLELAIETALLAAWLVRSDEVVLTAERDALAGSLRELFGLPGDLAECVAEHSLSFGSDQLPRQRELVERVAGRTPTDCERLVEALLAVASADGSIHRRELALIRRLADAVELPDAVFQDLLGRQPATREVQRLHVPLGSDPVTVGRSETNTIQLPSLSVSRHHARFVPVDGGWSVEDLGSATGTRVDGRRVRARRLGPADLVQVENFCFRLDPAGERLTLWNENDLLALSVEELTVEVPDRGTGRPRRILDAVSFTCFSGELVAVTGPSGSGKTTLIHALLGVTAAAGGTVRLNGRPCPGLLAHHARRLGLVPQDDIVHGELTVEESLFYSGALRAVPGVGGTELDREVDRVVEELGLAAIRCARIGDPVRRGISGGERKRVNLGQELLDPSTEILILDEPTTGLDPHTGMDIFRLLRDLADRGRLVLVVTHRVDRETLGLMDRILALGSGGRLSFFGPPREAFDFFGVDSVPALFDQLRDPGRAERLAERYDGGAAGPRLSAAARESVPGETSPEAGPEPEAGRDPLPRRAWNGARQWLRQYALQTLRYARIKARDRTALAINFGQIPLIVIGCWAVLSNSLSVEDARRPVTVLVVPAALPFVLVISAFWLGCVSAIRELVAEQAVRRRERMVGVAPGAYLLSKLTVLSLVTGLQCLLLVVFTEGLFELGRRHVDLGEVLAVLFLVGLVGVGLGLCASAFFRTPEAAVAVLPVLVIPQLLFGGVLAPFDEMPEPMAAVSYTMVSRWGVDGFVRAGDPGIGDDGLTDPDDCTVLTIPGTRVQQCLRPFLESLGLAPERQPGSLRERFEDGFGRSAAALAGLAGAAFLASFVLVRRRS